MNVPKKTRRLLKGDQGKLCAYCEQKFKSKVFIEHYISQDEDPGRVLDYTNFLGICSGKEYLDPKVNKSHISHCGDKKGSQKIDIDPRNAEHIEQIYYESDASIRSRNSDHDIDLNETLNLNFEILRERRNESFKSNYSNLIKVSKLLGWSKEEELENAIETLRDKKVEFNGYLLYRYQQMVGSLA